MDLPAGVVARRGVHCHQYIPCPTARGPVDSKPNVESVEVSPLSQATRRVAGRAHLADERTFTSWSRGHAVVMLAGFVGAAVAGSPWPLSLAALLSSAELFRRGWGAFTPAGRFGWANRVTTVRFALALLLGTMGPATPRWMLAAALGVAAALDVADGFIARRYGLSSAFGAAFDIETDALLTLIAEAQLWQRGRAGAWILIPGLLRYGYVLALAIVPATAGHVRSSRFGRRAFVSLLIGLVVAMVFDGGVPTVLVAIGTIAVTISFVRSFRWSYGAR
jgi:phosphatidylglycerophosphate synthase